MSKINASIVVYKNSKEQLMKAVRSILSSEQVSSIYVIYNSAASEEMGLYKKNAKIKYIYNDENIGYGAGHNIAIRESIKDGADYHVVLNPDVYFDSSIISKLADYADAHKDVGLIMPKILYPNGSVQFLAKLLPTPIDLMFRRFLPFKSYKEKRNKKYELRFTNYERVMNVPYLSGCFMFLNTKTLKDVGLFDENIFMYTEDTDLSRRIHRNYKTIFYPHVHIYHEYAKGSYKSSKLMIHHIKSVIYYFNKWGWFFDAERSRMNKRVLRSLSI